MFLYCVCVCEFVVQVELAKLPPDATEDDKSVVMLQLIHGALRGPIVACCFKKREQ